MTNARIANGDAGVEGNGTLGTDGIGMEVVGGLRAVKAMVVRLVKEGLFRVIVSFL